MWYLFCFDEKEKFNFRLLSIAHEWELKPTDVLDPRMVLGSGCFHFDAFYGHQVLIRKPLDTKTRVFQRFV